MDPDRRGHFRRQTEFLVKKIFVLLFLVALGGFGTQAVGQTYPTRPVTIIVPVAAGGAVDTAARVFAKKLSEKFKTGFVVENRPGAGAMVGTGYVAKAAPDGYTLLLMDGSVVVVDWLNKTVPFDIHNDFTFIARIVANPLVLVANASFPAGNMKEFIAYAKEHPGKLSVGTAGVGTPHHLALLMLNAQVGLSMTHLPYRGSAPSLNDLLGNQIPLIFSAPNLIRDHLESKAVKALAVTTKQRLASLPDIPAFSEFGLPEFDLRAVLGFAAPAGLPQDIAEKLDEAVREIAAIPEVQQQMLALGQYLDYQSGPGYKKWVFGEHKKFGEIIRGAGIEPQ